MRALLLIVHVSLDGFVAGAAGELDAFPAGDENLAFVCQLTSNADAALFGRTSYDLLNGYWPTAKYREGATAAEKAYSNWYNEAEKIVVSRTLTTTTADRTTISHENIIDEISKMKKGPGKDVLIFGSPTVTRELIKNDLIDSY